MFRCVIARNPVIDLAAMAPVTDIPDWTFTEVGEQYNAVTSLPLNVSDLELMKNMSPVAYIDRIACPFLLMVGDKDLRVPPSQGYSFYYALKARGKDVE